MFKWMKQRAQMSAMTPADKVMDLTTAFLKAANGQCPDEFERRLTADSFHVLIGFQFGAVIAAAYHVGLDVNTTLTVYQAVLCVVNGMSTEKALQVSQRAGELEKRDYPPIEVGSESFLAFYQAVDDHGRVAAASRLWQLLEPFEGKR